jgi:lipid-A-disaccharide synthase
MNREWEIFIVAAERSGDMHAAEVARELSRHPSVRLTGIGGAHMRQAGVVTDFDSTDWSAVGLLPTLRKVPYVPLKRRMMRLVRQRRPDLILLVDFGAYNMRFGRYTRQARPEQPIMYYFPPGSWRRQPRDWSRLAAVVDTVATPFRWSAEQLRAAGIDAHWVGHPVVERFSGEEDAAQVRSEHGLPEGAPVIGLMPGTRPMERNCIGPQLLGAAELLRNSLPDAHFLWSVTDPQRPHRLDRRVNDRSYITTLADSRTLILASDLVVVASGTATLECAAALRPMIMVYRGTWALALQARLMNLGTDYYAMPNIIADRLVVPELLQCEVNPSRICQEVLDLHGNAARSETMKQDLAQVRAELGSPGASQRTAELAWALMTRAAQPPGDDVV